MAEFIAWAKQKGKTSFGSQGRHLAASPGVVCQRADLDGACRSWRGADHSRYVVSDVTAIDNLASYVPFFQSGRMRALAVTSAQRWPTMPDVPTMAEAGLKDFVVTSWAAFVVPAGTPRPIIDKLAATMKQIAAEPEMQKRFQVAGARCISSTPEQALAYAAKERAMWKEVVALSGAKAN